MNQKMSVNELKAATGINSCDISDAMATVPSLDSRGRSVHYVDEYKAFLLPRLKKRMELYLERAETYRARIERLEAL